MSLRSYLRQSSLVPPRSPSSHTHTAVPCTLSLDTTVLCMRVLLAGDPNLAETSYIEFCYNKIRNREADVWVGNSITLHDSHLNRYTQPKPQAKQGACMPHHTSNPQQMQLHLRVKLRKDPTTGHGSVCATLSAQTRHHLLLLSPVTLCVWRCALCTQHRFINAAGG